jgi:hypothetical protein
MRHLTSAIAAALLLAAPAGASAATFTLDQPCVREESGVGFSLAGFAPNAFVRLLQNSDLIDAIQMGDNGGFEGNFPSFANGDLTARAVTITATDDAGITLTQPLGVVDLLVGMSPSKARPATKVTFKALGFVEGGTLYAHYTYSKSETKKIPVKTVKLGKLGPCGALNKKMKQLPLKHPKPGVYEIQFDTNPAYKRQVGVYAERTVFVPKKR